MTRILQLSDTHFGTERKPVVEAALDLARALKPDLVVLSGDITQRARRAQFAVARRFIERLSLPVLAVPGNHDIPLYNVFARALNPYGNYRRALGAVLEPVFESPGLLAVGVNTTRPRRHKDGEISDTQIARVAQRLRQARPGQLRIVVAHHPVRAKVESDLSNLLKGRERALAAWAQAGIDLVLGGHIHLPYVLPLSSANGPAGWIVQAGTACSRRVRGSVPNSVNVITHEDEGGQPLCHVERWDYAEATHVFAPVDKTLVTLT
ncbi:MULTISPECIES: metallophosphoesterase family protein [Achromobacter]|uniref:Metallophosphoesterase family protein n=1 Tax=Achromobacter spanius TaxID=217203 RepID=A0ABY8GT22_9BURK|nr:MULTISPECIES: metallophosphoesterase family protein [Achromobacter]WAI82989.1 metallophosphoesterase [Achromobacter spanius]WEX93075.1 metallophosphoesterase [Achromobacter sp. SS2-2022]WFP07771.1 metallophosphoesterase family protein [Achromobacter spanius]